jgi:hypothetical protein
LIAATLTIAGGQSEQPLALKEFDDHRMRRVGRPKHSVGPDRLGVEEGLLLPEPIRVV